MKVTIKLTGFVYIRRVYRSTFCCEFNHRFKEDNVLLYYREIVFKELGI